MNESEVGRCAGMDYNEGREVEFEGGARGWDNGRNKRKKDSKGIYSSDEERLEHVERESPAKCVVVKRDKKS